MDTVFLFGAGASYGSGDCFPHPPPVGQYLFPALKEWGGVAATVDRALSEKFAANFEDGMDHFFRTRNREVGQLLREMVLYLVQFRIGETNLYRDVVRLAAAVPGSTALATLNYDLLLEQAILELGYRVRYTTAVGAPPAIPVLKLHGSCNFLLDTDGAVLRNCFVDLSTNPYPGAAAVSTARTRIASSVAEIVHYCRTEDSIAPSVAIYARGKRIPYSPDFPKQQQREFADRVRAADRVFVIGVRVNRDDTHIWTPIAEGHGDLRWTGKEKQEFEDWVRDAGRERAAVLGSTFAEAMPLIQSLA